MLSNKLYDALKWICMIFLGAFGELYFGLSGVWNLPLGEEVRQTCHYLQVFLGACLGISAIQYKHAQNTDLLNAVELAGSFEDFADYAQDDEEAE